MHGQQNIKKNLESSHFVSCFSPLSKHTVKDRLIVVRAPVLHL